MIERRVPTNDYGEEGAVKTRREGDCAKKARIAHPDDAAMAAAAPVGCGCRSLDSPPGLGRATTWRRRAQRTRRVRRLQLLVGYYQPDYTYDCESGPSTRTST